MDAEILTVDHLHQYAYCPRRMHLMYVDGRWAGNEYTEEGRNVHRRVDAKDEPLPETPMGGDDPPTVARSVMLSCEQLGLVAKLNLVEIKGIDEPEIGADGNQAALAAPVETKRGKVPDNPERSWEPERVQLMAQGLLLRAHGYQVDKGFLYFAGSRTRVEIPFSPELEARTRHLLQLARQAAQATVLPLPLADSPKCVGCSLSGICLPDETLALAEVPADGRSGEVRRLYPARDDAQPFYVQELSAPEQARPH